MPIQLIRIQRDPPSNVFDTLTAETITATTVNAMTVNSDIVGDVIGDVTGNVIGDVTGDLTGNVTGNVVGDLTGNVTGNVTGDLTGDVTGDVTGDLTGDVDGGNIEGTAGQFGNVAGSNYSEFEADGTLKFNGDATVWEDIRVPLERAKLAGANVPTYAQFKDNGAGSAGVYAYDFDDGDEIWLSVQMPHSWKEGSIIYPHIHFVSATDGTGKNTKLTLEYEWTSLLGTHGNTTIVNRDVALMGAYVSLLYDIPDGGISGAGQTISSFLTCRIARNAADSDNFAGDIFFLEFDVHYEVDTVGSRQILVK